MNSTLVVGAKSERVVKSLTVGWMPRLSLQRMHFGGTSLGVVLWLPPLLRARGSNASDPNMSSYSGEGKFEPRSLSIATAKPLLPSSEGTDPGPRDISPIKPKVISELRCQEWKHVPGAAGGRAAEQEIRLEAVQPVTSDRRCLGSCSRTILGGGKGRRLCGINY